MKRPPVALAFLASVLAIYLILPFGAGLSQAGVADWGSADLPALASASAVSLASATLATALLGVCGVPLGYFLARKPGPWMAALGFVVQLPLALPPLTSGVLLLFLLGYSSPLGRLTNGALTDSFTGIVLAETFVAAPFLIIAAQSAFAGVDPALEGVAATLGHRPWSVFLRVSLPLASKSIGAGLLLAWLRAFGEFGATVMVAYHPYSLPVFTYVAFGSEGLPAMMPVLAPTLIAALAVMVASQFLRAPQRKRQTTQDPVASGALMNRNAPAPSLAGAGSRSETLSLDLSFQRRVSDFEINVAWRTSARRLAILGASGSGKSMTLRLIAGLDSTIAPTLRLNGRDLSGLPPHDRGVAYIPQTYGLFPNLPVDKQIRFSIACDPYLARRWTGRLGLAGLERRRPSQLSLGQQQRVALARALSRRADLLLLDEPFSALDAPLRARLRQELLELQLEFEATTILVTHDPVEALLLADELLLLDGGHVLQTGAVEAVFSRPANESVARLLGAENIGHGRAVAPNCIDAGDGVLLIVAGAPLRTGERIGWSVRSEQIRLTQRGAYSARVAKAADIRAGQRALTLRLGNAVLHVQADPSYSVGESCRIAIDPHAVQVWPVAD